MKFGRQLIRDAYPQYRHFYIAYKDLKQAIKLITGSDASAFSIQQVTHNFGNVPAFAGSVFRPPESRFQDLLNSQKEKINKFLDVTLTAVHGALKYLLKDLLRDPSDDQYVTNLDGIEQAVDDQAEELIFLESYQRINHIGFRKITKKYDKHNQSNSSTWYMAQLAKEPFMNADFDEPLRLLSLCYRLISTRREAATSETRGKNPSSLNTLSPPAAATPPPVVEEKITSPPRGSVESNCKRTDARYLVQTDELMKLKVLLSKFVPMTSTGTMPVDMQAMANHIANPLSRIAPGGTGTVCGGNPNDSSHAGTERRTSAAASPGGFRSRVSHCCVYFDTENLDTYKSLLGGRRRPMSADEKSCSKRINELWVYRLRWTGKNGGEPEKDIVFELVEVHESPAANCECSEMPIGQTNRRNAVVIKQKHLLDILRGTFNVQAWLDRKKITANRQAEIKEFLETALSTIKLKKLIPVVQVWYYRTSFRLDFACSPNKSLFVHVDEAVSFVSELQISEGIIVSPTANELEVKSHTKALTEDHVERLPFGVLSVSFCHDTVFPCELMAPRLIDDTVQESSSSEDDSGGSRAGIGGGSSAAAAAAATGEEGARKFLAQKHAPCAFDMFEFVDMVTSLTSVTEVWSFTYYGHGVSLVTRPLRIKLPVPHWFKFLAIDPNNSDSPNGGPDKRRSDDDDDDDDDDDHDDNDDDEVPLKVTAGATISGLIGSNSTAIKAPNHTTYESVASRQSRIDILKDCPEGRLIRDHEEELKYSLYGQDFDKPRASAGETGTAGGALSSGLAPDGRDRGAGGNRQQQPTRGETESRRGGAGDPLLPLPKYLDGCGRSFKGASGGGGFLGLDATVIPMAGDDETGQQITGQLGRPLHELSKPLFEGRSVAIDHRRTDIAGRSATGGVGLALKNAVRKCYSLFWWPRKHQSNKPESAKIINAAVRVEPKTFFANERTLLQWLNTAVLLATISITLLNFGNPSGRLAGLIMGPIAIFFIIHAYIIYIRRGRALVKKEPIDYADRTGPLILVVTLVIGLSIVIGLNLFSHRPTGHNLAAANALMPVSSPASVPLPASVP